MLQRPVESGQYTSFAFTAHLLDAGIDASIGTVGDARANALMESQIGLYKTELIKHRKPWHGLADVELATAEKQQRWWWCWCWCWCDVTCGRASYGRLSRRG
ncbi:hypothetical protein FEF34_28250 [Streptomyces marianii]|uniref:Transposase n=1 Tax=Streptomyces marianii TaxID=1817406 RepID=A0A5R9E8P4_9ACTN|nr:hypothetical protein FEF34_28250 [Streptomyces marianii]